MTDVDELESFILRSADLTGRRMVLSSDGRSKVEACMLALIDYALCGINQSIALAVPHAMGREADLAFIRHGLEDVESALNMLDPPRPFHGLKVVK